MSMHTCLHTGQGREELNCSNEVKAWKSTGYNQLIRVGGGGARMNAPVRIRCCTQVKDYGKTRLQGVGHDLGRRLVHGPGEERGNIYDDMNANSLKSISKLIFTMCLKHCAA